MTPETQRAVLSREPYFCSADCASVSKQLAEVCGRGMMKVRRCRRRAVNTQTCAVLTVADPSGGALLQYCLLSKQLMMAGQGHLLLHAAPCLHWH
jgi:hypothetical protein